MNDFKVKNDNGLELIITQNEVEEYEVMSGGDSSNPSWEEYLSNYKDEFKPHVILLKEAIEKIGWIGEKAESICNYTWFVFSDGQKWGFTWRAWGDLMQAIVNKNEGYMTYYM